MDMHMKLPRELLKNQRLGIVAKALRDCHVQTRHLGIFSVTILLAGSCADQSVIPEGFPGVPVEVRNDFFGYTNGSILIYPETRMYSFLGDRSWSAIEFGIPCRDNPEVLPRFIRLEDGHIVDTRSANLRQTLEAHGLAGFQLENPAAAFSYYLKPAAAQWSPDTWVIRMLHVEFYFREETLLGVSMHGGSLGHTTDRLVPLPLNGDEVRELFGQPDQIVVFFRE
jgi:hypothetical protein